MNGFCTSPPEREQMDFRSPRFCDQARALARMTGCALALCRQELFIAEGDAAEAYFVLSEGRPGACTDHRFH